MIRIRAPQDFAAGCMFIAISVFFLWFGRDLSIGTSSFMEAGYFPRLASFLLAFFGAWIVLFSLKLEGPQLERWAWRPLIVLTLAVAGFGFIVTFAGLVITTFAVVITTTLAGFQLRAREAVVLAVALSALMVLLFHFGLNLPIPVWPRW